MAKQSVKVNEFKINIGGRDYTFRLDFAALIKFEEKYEMDGMVAFNGFLQGKNTYRNIIKILSCACVERDFTEDELARGLSFDFKTMQLMDKVAFALVEGVFAETDTNTDKEDSEAKNAPTSQKKKKA